MNTQHPSKPTYHPVRLDVQSFFTSIQGEGVFVGRPAIFIRLAGCNIQCPHCDTNYSHGQEYELTTLVGLVESVQPRIDLVVITGGEPLRQDIGRLVNALFERGHTIQIETNGTLSPGCVDFEKCYIVCSPKLKLDPTIALYACALKYVLHADYVDPADGLPTATLGHKVPPGRPPEGYKGIIYVQPLDVGNPAENARHLKAAVDSCMRFGYTLCLQIHKIINME